MSWEAERAVALYFYRLSEPGGAERMICQLAGELALRGFKVYLVSLDEQKAESFYPLHESVRWERLGFRAGIRDKIRRTRLLARVLKRNRIRALVGFVMSGDRSVYVAAKLAGTTLIAAERNAPTMYRLRYNRLQRWMMYGFLHFADYITIQMPGFLSGYPSSLERRIKIIPNPVPVVSQRAKPELPNNKGRFTLLAVSRLDNVQKRIDCLIRAYCSIKDKHPDWELKIVGDGPEYNSLIKLARDLGADDRICLHPSTSEIFNCYLSANLFVIPSLWEGFPNSLAEAMAHGLPAVGFRDAAGVAELIRDGGWLAAGLDSDSSLAHALDSAMSDAVGRAARGKDAACLMGEFAPRLQFDRWEALLGPLVSEARR